MIAALDHPPRIASLAGGPAWEVALLFPRQGEWSEAEFLALQRRTNRLVEFSDGMIEVLSVPNPFHQRLVRFLFRALESFVLAHGLGEVFFAPLPIRLRATKYRDPDVCFLRPGRITDPRHQPTGADLVMEVVSDDEDDRERDLITKRAEYAQAGIAEYWIVDPREQQVSVLVLDQGTYRVHGEFGVDQTATSVLLLGFSVAVAALFAAGA